MVNLTIVIQQQVAFESGAAGGEAIDAFEFLPLGIEGGDFEYVLEESDAGGGGDAAAAAGRIATGHIIRFQ